jgi:DNA-binding beta-propeller fold protein YncE
MDDKPHTPPARQILVVGVLIAGLALSAPAQAELVATPPPPLACAAVIPGASVTITVPGRPFAAVASPDGCVIFVSLSKGGATRGQNGLAVLKNEGGSYRLTRVVDLKGESGGVAITPDGKRLLVADGDALAVLDAERLAAGPPDPPVEMIKDPEAGAVYVAVTPDGATAFVSDERAARLSVVDLKKGKVISQLPQGLAPVGLAVSGDGARLYATSEVAPAALRLPETCPPENGAGPSRSQGALFAIDVAKARRDPKHAVVGAAAAGCSPVRVVLSPDGTSAWVTARGSDELMRYATAQLEGKGRVPGMEAVKVGRSPVGVAASSDGHIVWVANSDRLEGGTGGSLSFVRVGQGAPSEVVLTRPAGAYPRDLNLLPDGQTLIVAEYGAKRIVLVPQEAKD